MKKQIERACFIMLITMLLAMLSGCATGVGSHEKVNADKSYSKSWLGVTTVFKDLEVGEAYWNGVGVKDYSSLTSKELAEIVDKLDVTKMFLFAKALQPETLGTLAVVIRQVVK